MDLFDFAKEQQAAAAPDPEFYKPEAGHRVMVPSIGQTGVIDYIDQRTLFVNEYFPIQVILDKPYDDSTMIRTNLRDIQKEGEYDN